jgi:uncharacterized membrane protein YcaP (DUF421 family)
MKVMGRKSVHYFNYLDMLMASFSGNMLGYYTAGQTKGSSLLVAPAVVTASTILTEVASIRNRKLRRFIEGDPLIIIRKGKIIEGNIKRARYNLNEIFIAFRDKGIFDISQVDFAIIETDGRITVMKKQEYQAATPSDLGLTVKSKGLPSVIISDGIILTENLRENQHDLRWLKDELKKKGVGHPKQVFLAVLTSDNSLFVDLKE